MLDEKQKNIEDKFCVHCGTLTDSTLGQCKLCNSRDFRNKNTLEGHIDNWMFYAFFGSMALVSAFLGFLGFFICGLGITECIDFEPKRILPFMLGASIVAVILLFNCFTILKYGREHKMLKYLSVGVVVFIYWFLG